MNQHTIFPKVEDFYADLVSALSTAQEKISLTYLSFDSGVWAEKISAVLIAKAASGVSNNDPVFVGSALDFDDGKVDVPPSSSFNAELKP